MALSPYEELKWLFSELLNESLQAQDSSIVWEFLQLLDEGDREDLLQYLFGQALIAKVWWLAEDCLAYGLSIAPKDGCADGPLHVALYYCGDSPDVVAWMLDHGAELERRDWGQSNTTPLMHATALGLVAVVELLLQRGADPNARRVIDDDDTALMLAAKTGNKKIVELLLAYGAEIDRRNRWGQDAATLARSAGHGDVYQLILGRKSGEGQKATRGQTHIPGGVGKLH